MFKRTLAIVVLTGLYGLTWLIALIAKMIPHNSWKPTWRILVTGTFHNPNWYLAHLTPLARSELKEVILVVDEPQAPMERVRFVCPPRWLAKLIGRAGAKALWVLGATLRYQPDLCMGYHIMPGAASALVVGSLLGRPTCYQMTGGPIEILGGGVYRDGWVGQYLKRPSRFLEKLASAVVRQFDLVVVRGEKAERFLRSRGVRNRITVITGSIRATSQPQTNRDRDIDLIYVGRLSPVKRPDVFLQVVKQVSRARSEVTAMVVGDGPLMEELRRLATLLGLDGQVQFVGKQTDVESLLRRAKVFLLTSRSEGLSIALAEAMAAGAAPVVSDVGELAGLVRDGENGYLVAPNRIGDYADRARSLLDDEPRREHYGQAAARAAIEYCSLDTVADRWKQSLGDLIRQSTTNAADV